MADRLVALPEWEPTMEAIARGVARRYPHTDWEDVAQEMRLWWVSTNRVDGYLDEDTEEDKEGTKKLMRSLTRVGRGVCEQDKASATGYHVGDLYWYSQGLLRELLPLYFQADPTTLAEPAPEGGVRVKRPLNEGNNLPAALADLSRGLASLSAASRELLVSIYRDGATEAELAIEAGISVEGMNKRHDRALAALRDRLGGEPPIFYDGPGSRRAISNANAQAMTGGLT